MLVKRILTALIGIPVSFFIVVKGGALFVAAIAVLALIAWREWFGICEAAGLKIAYFFGAVFLLLTLACAWMGNGGEIYALATFFAFASLSLAVLKNEKYSVQDAAFNWLGFAYIGMGFVHVVLLRFLSGAASIELNGWQISCGALYLICAFLGIWASDTMAFFVGRQFGRRKLCPKVSPGKTWEGFCGGAFFCVLIMIYLGKSWLGLNPWGAAGLGVLIALTAPLGDLAESVVKRFAGVKDSGAVFPGHGGVLDRFDSLLFAVPVVYYYIQAVAG